MALITVQTKGFDSINRFFGSVLKRAKGPRRYVLETSDRLAKIHQQGGRQRVTRPVQRAIAAKTGVAPPKVGKTMIHPERPVRVTPSMAKEASRGLVRFYLLGGQRGIERSMRKGVAVQFARGGVPFWRRSRDWGRLRAARPTLGGAGGRVAAGWRRARFTERR